MKNELNKFLLECDKIKLSCEKLYNSIKFLENEDENNKIKSLYYISEINKSIDEAKIFLKKPMKNINIIFPIQSLFSSFTNIPNYNFYYFNGIPAPKEINIVKKKDQAHNILISWKLEDLKYDYKSIKYLVEIKDVNNKSCFTFDVIGLNFMQYICKIDANYEIKMRVIIDDIYGDWSEVKKFNENNLPEEGGNIFGNPISIFGNNNSNSLFGINSTNNNSIKIQSEKLNKNLNNLFEKSNGNSLFGNNIKDNNDANLYKKKISLFENTSEYQNLFSQDNKDDTKKSNNQNIFTQENKENNDNLKNLFENKNNNSIFDNLFNINSIGKTNSNSLISKSDPFLGNYSTDKSKETGSLFRNNNQIFASTSLFNNDIKGKTDSIKNSSGLPLFGNNNQDKN